MKTKSLSRRSAIAGGIAAGTAALAIKAKGGVAPFDPVIPLAETYLRADAETNALQVSHDAGAISGAEFEARTDIAFDRGWKAFQQLSGMEARTLAGVAAQARAMEASIPVAFLDEDGPDAALARNIANALDRLVQS